MFPRLKRCFRLACQIFSAVQGCHVNVFAIGQVISISSKSCTLTPKSYGAELEQFFLPNGGNYHA